MSSLGLLIPAYNAAGLLPRLIASARAQSRPFDEIWVYDDCSKDETAAVAEALGARVVRGETNRGCTWGKSVLVERTTCEWVHFHDADDLLLPNFMDVAGPWLDRDDADVVLLGCEERWEDSRDLVSTSVPDDARLRQDANRELIVYKANSSSGLYRRSRFREVGGFDLDPAVLYNEDQALHSKLARDGLGFAGEPTVACLYLRQISSMSNSNLAKCHRARFHVLKKIENANPGRYRDELAGQYWGTAACAAAQLDWDTADLAVEAAMRLGTRRPSLSPFGLLCRIDPKMAIRVREAAIRRLKPDLRVGYPA